jgi:glycosyltransferase involved in cell wall biosynthesis
MTETPLVSIIVVFYNARRFLREAIDSVFAQTYTLWELLLVDDGSTDSGSEIAASYVSRYPDRVRYLEHDRHMNLGISASRNCGIRRAAGDLIATLDADDVWPRCKLLQQVRILSAFPDVGMTYGRTLNWHSWKGSASCDEPDNYAPMGLEPGRVYRPPILFKKAMEGTITTPSMSGICFRREVIQRTGGFEEEFRGMFEDQVFLVKLFLAEAVYVSSEVWDKYRIHEDSCCAIAEAQGMYPQAHLAYLSWVRKYLIAEGLEGVGGWLSLRISLWPYQFPALAPLFRYAKALRFRLVTFVRKALSLDPLIDRQRTPPAFRDTH